MENDPVSAPLDFSGLNPAQREAVLSTEGPLLILAGAGSGKTRVITHRIARLVKDCGVPPGAILAVTFTNKAAGEMKERVETLTGLPARSLWVSTFHSAAVRMLRIDGEAIGHPRDFVIYDDGDTDQLLKVILRDLGLDPKIEKPGDYAAAIGRAKDELLSPEAWLDKTRILRGKAERVYDVFRAYQERLARAHALDFGDLLAEAVRLLDVPEVRERWQRRFRYVLVDEYQDTNMAQCKMMQVLAGATRNLCVVGDDDQSIYEWRGADRRNILEFERLYPDAKVVVLAENYRSKQPILDAASNLIGHNPRIREKKLFTSQQGGTPPVVFAAGNEYREVERVVDEIKANARAGTPLRENAIFYRVHAQTRVVEEMLAANGIPYQLLTGLSFYQRKEVKDVMAYLKLIANPADDLALRRVINNPSRGIGETTIEKLAARAGEQRKALFDILPDVDGILDADGTAVIALGTRRKLKEFHAMVVKLRRKVGEAGVAELLSDILEETRYTTQYDPTENEDAERIGNVRELLSVAQEFQASQEDPSLASFLERTALATDVDDLDPDADTVILSTLHSAKGLEFDHVFIIGCEESLFPHSRAFEDARPAALEEERRLAYVGFTRARKTLMLTCAVERRIYGKILSNPPSRFLEEAGLERPIGRAASLATPSFFSPPRRRQDSAWTSSTQRSTASSSYGASPTYSVKKSAITQAPRVAAPRPAANPGMPLVAGAVGVLSEGDTVTHRKFGRGTVIYVSDSGDDNEVAQVKFASGVKSLMSKFAGLTKQ